MEFSPPLKGILKGISSDKPIKSHSEYMNNCRPKDSLEGKLRIGKRDGLDKWGAGTLVGGANLPIVAVCSVSSVV